MHIVLYYYSFIPMPLFIINNTVYTVKNNIFTHIFESKRLHVNHYAFIELYIV